MAKFAISNRMKASDLDVKPDEIRQRLTVLSLLPVLSSRPSDQTEVHDSVAKRLQSVKTDCRSSI